MQSVVIVITLLALLVAGKSGTQKKSGPKVTPTGPVSQTKTSLAPTSPIVSRRTPVKKTGTKAPGKKTTKVIKKTPRKGAALKKPAKKIPVRRTPIKRTVPARSAPKKPLTKAHVAKKRSAPIRTAAKKQPNASNNKANKPLSPAQIEDAKEYMKAQEPIKQAGDRPIDDLIATPSEASQVEPYDRERFYQSRAEMARKEKEKEEKKEQTVNVCNGGYGLKPGRFCLLALMLSVIVFVI